MDNLLLIFFIFTFVVIAIAAYVNSRKIKPENKIVEDNNTTIEENKTKIIEQTNETIIKDNQIEEAIKRTNRKASSLEDWNTGILIFSVLICIIMFAATALTNKVNLYGRYEGTEFNPLSLLYLSGILPALFLYKILGAIITILRNQSILFNRSIKK